MPLLKANAINAAEGILDPFWDTALSQLAKWHVTPGDEHGLRVKQNWCWASFEWNRKPAQGPALRMSRQIEADCTGYDRLIVSVMAPLNSIFRLTAKTDRGTRSFTSGPAPALKKEHALSLDGAAVIHEIIMEVDAADEGNATGWFNWVGLQNSAMLERVNWVLDRFDASWEGYLQPESYDPKFEPVHGLVVTKEELESLRAKHDAFLKIHGDSPFTLAGKNAQRRVPEKMVGEFVNFWNDTRYCRERDYDKTLLVADAVGLKGAAPMGNGVHAVIAGLLLKDKALLRLGARYVMALAMCGRWDDGMICYMPGGIFEHRCFVQSLCVHEAALVLELAGEMFTSAGREYLKRRIAEEGIGAINFNAWKYEYIFHCNQLAWFSPGRMMGYTLLEKSWPRMKPYTELAYNDLVESLGYAILPDGGYVEGPTYFRCVGRDGGLSLYYYARSRGKELKDIIPPIMKLTGDFAAAVCSTDDHCDVISICDAGKNLEVECLAVMAMALPQSPWVSMLRKSLARTHGMANTLLACKLEAEAPKEGPAVKEFVYLPEMGLMASTRRAGDAWTKILIMGNKKGAGHTHEDKGSFVLEFNGETYATDPGTCDYSSPLAGQMQHCQRHNMLIPTGTTHRPAPQNPLQADVKPLGRGDAVRFDAAIDVAAGWTHYKKWTRLWDSPTPLQLVVTDEWELAENGGDGVVFYWQTALEVVATGTTVTIVGRRGKAVIDVPQGTAVTVEELQMPAGRTQRRVGFVSRQTSGKMVVSVRLIAG